MSDVVARAGAGGRLTTRDLPGVAAAVVACLAVGLTPAAFVGTSGSRSAAQVAPPISPPGVLVAAVWPVLFALLGVAAYLVWRDARTTRAGRVALAAFAVQFACNVAWTLVVFGTTGSYALGLAMFVPLDLAVLATVLAFARVDRRAALLLVPYLAWVAFATVVVAWGYLLNT